MIKKYREKPEIVEVEAVQFLDTTESLVQLSELGLDPVRVSYYRKKTPVLVIDSGYGRSVAQVRDYVVKEADDKFFVYSEDDFHENYEKVEEDK